jgi:GntR family transcriptional regulator of arabinose operon
MGRRNISNELAQRILGRITAGEYKPGQFLPPERELAESYDVNRLTLRKALAVLQERGLLERRRGRGTSVAIGANAGAGANSGPGIAWLGQHDTHIFTDLFFSLNRAASARSMALSVLAEPGLTGWSPVGANGSPNHIICTVGKLAQAAALPRDPGGVLVCIDILPQLTSTADVTIWGDRNGAMALAVRSLARQGHRRIAYVGRASDGEEGQPGNPGARLYGAYREELRQHGLSWHRLIDGSRGDGSEASMDAAIADQLAEPGSRPTACVCDMDWRALSVMRAASAVELAVPRDLSVIGLGDTPWAEAVRPALTSVSFPVEAMAQLAVDCIANGRSATPRIFTVTGQVVERGTAAAPA